MSAVTPLPGSRADKVDAVAQAVRAVPGVADLHGGVRGEIGTYLPGRQVAGIRLRPDGTEVHVTLEYRVPVRETAAAVRSAVAQVVPGPVDVVVEDVQSSAAPAVEQSSAAPALEAADPAAPGGPERSGAPGVPGDRDDDGPAVT